MPQPQANNGSDFAPTLDADKLLNAGVREFFDEEFARYLENKVRGQLGEEKQAANRRQKAIGRELQAEGSTISRVMGQKLGTIDARIYHRFNLEFPGCWKDPEFVQAFLADNPQCRAPGWRPKPVIGRKGVTYVGGAPISPHMALKTLL